jgi:hypothetical protein
VIAQSRCNRISRALVTAWNRRDAIRLELRHHKVEPDRHWVLESRLRSVIAEGDALELQMTMAAQALRREIRSAA